MTTNISMLIAEQTSSSSPLAFIINIVVHANILLNLMAGVQSLNPLEVWGFKANYGGLLIS